MIPILIVLAITLYIAGAVIYLAFGIMELFDGVFDTEPRTISLIIRGGFLLWPILALQAISRALRDLESKP